MSEPALYRSVQLEEHTCGQCGILYAAPAYFWDERRRNHSLGFYCPNGHQRVFLGETEAQKLQRELNVAKRDADWQRQLREKTEKKLRRAERRIQAGVCIHCNRTFQDVARHMRTKHSEGVL